MTSSPRLRVRCTGDISGSEAQKRNGSEKMLPGPAQWTRWLLPGEASMFWLRTALSAGGMLESVICCCLAAEIAGYWLHRLLHAAGRRSSLGNVGSKWLAPSTRSFLFDRIFRPVTRIHVPLKRKGYAVGLQRYKVSPPSHPLECKSPSMEEGVA